MKIGVCLPTETGAMGGESPSAQEILELAALSEEIGFDSIWIVDHFQYDEWAEMAALGANPPDSLQGSVCGAWEVFTMCSALAAVTRNVEIGTMVANTGYRNPALFARMVETIDAVSNGRFVCGVGAGDFESEHRAYGFPWERRIARFEEALQIIKPMLRGESVSFDGEFYQTQGALLHPRGPRAQGAPILIGLLKGGPRMKRLVAQYADIWNCWLASTDSHPEAYRQPLDEMISACQKHYRDPSTLQRNVVARVCPTSARPQGFDMNPITGSAGEIAEQLLGFEALGVDHLPIWPYPLNRAGIEALAPVLRHLRR